MKHTLEIIKDLSPYVNFNEQTLFRKNKFRCKAKCYPFNKEGMDAFNYVVNYLKAQKFAHLQMTRSGGIANGFDSKLFKTQQRGYYIENTKSYIMAIISIGAFLGKIKVGVGDEKKKESTTFNFKTFVKYIEETGVDLHDHEVSEEVGYNIKQSITKPMIQQKYAMKATSKGFDNVLIVDFNSAYLYNVGKYNKDLMPAMQALYRDKHVGIISKGVTVTSIGYCQSKYLRTCGFNPYGLSSLSKDAIEGNKAEMRSLINEFNKHGLEVIGTMTDGIAVRYFNDEQKQLVLKHKKFGVGLGQFKIKECLKYRSKSNGAYEYITTDGKYHPVLRGHSKLDDTTPRDNWKWGDIYSGELVGYIYDDKNEQLKEDM